ncbi:hypothetical protein [Kitasatospora sp. NBC_00315]|uniref:hypothetical protein n=1 Tax=Kitasatospora sp. NBC_00315 TaxID=2975963 RepID=UPI003246644F
MAVGIVAFGAGLLAAALLSASEVEQQGVAKLREHGHLLEPGKQAAFEAAQDVRDELREPAADTVQAVKASAQGATVAAGAGDPVLLGPSVGTSVSAWRQAYWDRSRGWTAS